ncbi:MAG: hypothetical protein QOE09_2712 [Ilumatobacteraceae bacterium]
MSELDELVHRADLDGLVTLVDKMCATGDWSSLLDLRNRCRSAIVTGRQLWPAATLAEYRLALLASTDFASEVLDEDSGRFTIGPLTEVVAQHHDFYNLRAALSDGPRLGFIAHECALRGQRIPDDLSNPLEIPFSLQPWEPSYSLAAYDEEGLVATAPRLPEPSMFRSMPELPDADVIDDPEVTLAVRQLIEPWVTSSNGRAEIIAVEGDAASAVAALGVTTGRLAPIDPSLAMAWLAWAGASGGAHGRRRGAAIGRFGAWWTIAALADLVDVWPVDPDRIGEALSSLDWFWFDADEARLGWELQLAVADPHDGYAWAISAHDAA